MPADLQAEPPFSHIAIAGLGLIGGSIALGVRSRWPTIRITGVDSPPMVSAARTRGIIDNERTSVLDVEETDLIVLATPVRVILDFIAELGRARVRTTITDVGSTKRRVMVAAEAAGLRSFVGGHPMAGAERSGLDAARKDLFTNRPWFLTPAEGASSDTSARLGRLVAGLGARPVTIEPDEHDRTMAYVSHVPQLMSVALMVAAAESVGPRGLTHAGRAFDEMTRLASSSSGMWESILETNRDNLQDALHAFGDTLSLVADPARLRDVFARANQWRDRFERQRDAGPG